MCATGEGIREDLQNGSTSDSVTNGSRQRILQNIPTCFGKGKDSSFSTHGDAKFSVVERLRFNRTLKTRMYRYFTSANTLRYDDVLQDLVRGYNASEHSSIGMAPKDVTLKNKRMVWKRSTFVTH